MASMNIIRGTRNTTTRTIAEGTRPPQGYSSFRNDFIHTIDAAALQSDIAQRYSLPGSRLAIQKQKKSRISSKTSVKKAMKACSSCHQNNPATNAVCEHCGYFMNGAPTAPISLAQHRGLVKSTEEKIPTLSLSEWKDIEDSLALRLDAHCPICMDGFNRGSEVLLSCSHMFHRTCLQSFEKFMKTSERCCPICRTANYQKKITHVGTTAYERLCAITIQKNWRGHWCRSVNYRTLRDFYKRIRSNTGSLFKKNFFQKELSNYTNKLAKEAKDIDGEVRTMFDSMDQTMAANRQLDLEFELMMMERRNYSELFNNREERDGTVDHSHLDSGCHDLKAEGKSELTVSEWQDVLRKSRARGDDVVECAICMSEIHKGNRRVVLLSCSHLYHQRCIMTLENFVKSDTENTCPMCRCPYEKRLLSRCLQTFDR